MNIKCFTNPDNVVYADVEEFADHFGKECGINDLRQQLEDFRSAPKPNGKVIKGTKRTAIRLLVPNLYFPDANIKMGDSVWVYLGESYEIYCLYWPA